MYSMYAAPEQPQHGVLDPLEQIHPHIEGLRVDLAQLPEVAEDKFVLRNAVLGAARRRGAASSGPGHVCMYT